MLSVVSYSHVECPYTECRYSKCHYSECRHAECRGALIPLLLRILSAEVNLIKFCVSNIVQFFS
jgi:hypothetical protein